MIKRFVVEMTFVVDDIGTEETFYYATSGFSTLPTDTPANTYIAPRLKSPGSYKRELFSGNRVTGAIRPSFGEIVLNNEDGGLDEFLGYGTSGGKVIVRYGDEGGAYPGDYTTVYIAYAQHPVANFDAIRIRVRDRLLLLDVPANEEAFDGTGGLEGDDTVAIVGNLKQSVFGSPGFYPPVLVDPDLLLYCVHGQHPGSSASFATSFVMEGGVVITRNTDYSTESQLLSTSPASGECRWWDNGGAGPVYFRLGSVPVYDIRVYCQGYKDVTNDNLRYSYFTDRVGLTTGAASDTPIGEQLIEEDSTCTEVMEEAAKLWSYYFGMSRLDVFYTDRLQPPYTLFWYIFNEYNAKNWIRTPVSEMDAPVYKLTINAGKTWPSSVALGMTDSDVLYLLTQAVWQSVYTEEDEDIQIANPGAIAATIDYNGREDNRAAADLIIANYFALYGVRRDFYTFTVEMNDSVLALELGTAVKIQLPRFGLDDGKIMRIITQEIDCNSRQIKYGVWG